MNFEVLTIYRSNFINSVLSTIVWGSMSFVSILLLTSRVNTVYGWTRSDLLLLTAIYNIIIGIFHTVFSRNFDRFSRIIHFGELDSLLVKPLDSQFLVSFWFFSYTSIFRIVAGIVVAAIILQSQTLNLLNVGIFVILIFVSISLMYSIWFLPSILIIKYSNLSNLVDLLYQINNFTRFPQELFKQLNIVVFSLLIPVTIAITTPTKFLISKASYADFFLLAGISMVFLICTRLAWKYALRFYSSASG